MQKVLSVVKDVASGLRTVLGVTKEVSDALPPLKGVVSGILAVWEVYDVRKTIFDAISIPDVMYVDSLIEQGNEQETQTIHQRSRKNRRIDGIG